MIQPLQFVCKGSAKVGGNPSSYGLPPFYQHKNQPSQLLLYTVHTVQCCEAAVKVVTATVSVPKTRNLET